jgi:hypothetical protein
MRVLNSFEPVFLVGASIMGSMSFANKWRIVEAKAVAKEGKFTTVHSQMDCYYATAIVKQRQVNFLFLLYFTFITNLLWNLNCLIFFPNI